MVRKDFKRKQNIRASYDRILIVCEGKKTECSYFKEICIAHRLANTNIQIFPSQRGTCPCQVVEYALDLFENGNPHVGIKPRAFEQIYTVFDRDDHVKYFDALKLASDQQLRNDLKQKVTVRATPSVPCFELWILLHFEEIQHPIHRNEVLKRLKLYIPDYEKGKNNIYNITKNKFSLAHSRANHLIQLYPNDGKESYTDVHQLVSLLINLNSN